MCKSSLIILLSVCLVGLVSSALIREGRITGDARLSEPGIQKCLDSKLCPITLDLTPTCASDGRTYSNLRVIDCLNECLKPEERLTVASRGYCKNDEIKSE